LLSIGVIGEYLGKMYIEIKARPRYFVEKTVPAAVESNLPADRPGLAAASTPKSLAERG